MPPMGIDIHHCKGGVAFFGDFNLHRVAIIMDQVVVIKNILPILSSTRPVKASQFEYPINRIMRIRRGRPRPGHIGMNDG
jgi:hypothetical protein